jgi:ribonucleoside-diphosphate reductase alpha chain
VDEGRREPNNISEETVSKVYETGCKSGCKGITVYRDGSKNWQPLNETKKEILEELEEEEDEEDEELEVEETEQDKQIWTAIQRKVPDEISLIRHKFNISGVKGYIKAGTYPNTDNLCEVWLKVSKSGSLINGLLDSLAIVWSLALQYGVPLEKLVDNLSSVKFEPSGWTTNSEIPNCSSIVDYVCKWLELKFISREVPVLVESTESKFVEEQPEHIEIINNYKKYYWPADDEVLTFRTE